MGEPEPETLIAEDNLDATRWDLLVENSPTPDVYYLPEYARASAEIETTEPLALIAGAQSCRMLAPLLLRRNSAMLNGSSVEWLDASTPYGYGGLLSLSSPGGIHPECMDCFVDQLSAWCSARHVVCCVIRLHPLIGQQDWFDGSNRWHDQLRLHSRGTTSSVELSQWNEKLDQPAGMRKGRYSDMRIGKRDLSVSWSTGEDKDADRSLSVFSALYDEFLDSKAADPFYRFPQRYFEKLRVLGTRLGIALAWYRDQPVGAHLFLAGPRYAHSHLAATNDIGRRHGASTFLYVEGARWARRRGCELLHLGGGMRPGDSLEDFKRSFGSSSQVYKYVTFIADRERFDEICRLPTASWPYNLPDSTAALEDGPTI